MNVEWAPERRLCGFSGRGKKGGRRVLKWIPSRGGPLNRMGRGHIESRTGNIKHTRGNIKSRAAYTKIKGREHQNREGEGRNIKTHGGH